MKKILVVPVILVVAFFALGSVGKVSASSENLSTVSNSVEYGFGGRGGMMGTGTSSTQQGLLHDEMIKVIAEKLGISVVDLEARLAKGETMYAIALAEGLTSEEATTLMVDARNEAIDQAVLNGDLTQIQADWMKSRSTMMGSGSRDFATNGNSNHGMMGGFRGTNQMGSCTGTNTLQ